MLMKAYTNKKGKSIITKVEEALTSLFLIYLIWYKEAYSSSNVILYGSVILLTATVFYDAVRTGYARKIRIVNVMAMYGRVLVYSLITGLFIAIDMDSFLNYIMRLATFTILCADCIFISRKEGSTDWILNIFAVCAILCALQAALFGVSYNGGATITMSHHNNPNKIGLTMVLGAIALLYNKEKFNKRLLLNLPLLLLFFYVVMRSGSRKSFLCIGAISALWAIDYFQSEFSRKLSGKKFFLMTFSAILIAFGTYYIITSYGNTALAQRMTRLTGELESGRRIDLYQEAIELWLNHPLFGIGYGQFAQYSRFHYYSHSTYAEILSCTGIIGTILFFNPLAAEFIKCVRLCFGKRSFRDREKQYTARMLLLIFLIELFLASVMILIYEIDHMLIITFLFLNIDRLTTERENAAETTSGDKAIVTT